MPEPAMKHSIKLLHFVNYSYLLSGCVSQRSNFTYFQKEMQKER